MLSKFFMGASLRLWQHRVPISLKELFPMSMHEFEDLVQLSVEVLAHQRPTDLDLRSAFATLYQLQAQFDCGFTHFRVMPELVQHRFVYRMTPPQHPRYPEPAVQALLDQPVEGVSFVRVDPLAPWGPDNPEAGYLSEGALYADAGSPLWAAWVAQGVLTGADAQPPQTLALAPLVLAIVQAADAMGAPDVIWLWFDLFPAFVSDDDETLQQLQSDPVVLKIREIFRRYPVQDASPHDLALAEAMAAAGVDPAMLLSGSDSEWPSVVGSWWRDLAAEPRAAS